MQVGEDKLKKCIVSGTIGVGMNVANACTQNALFDGATRATSTLLAIYIGNQLMDLYFEYKYSELKKLYDEFLKNYSEFNNMFELKNPIEIYAMYSYLLWNGFLSKDGVFEPKNTRNGLPLFLATPIFSGEGVCRHISQLLVDIFNYNGIKAHNLVVYESTFHENKLVLNELGKKFGNHAITYVSNKGYVYLLDPTNNETLDFSNGKIIRDDREIRVKRVLSPRYLKKLKECYEIIKSLNSGTLMPKGARNLIADETVSRCEDNLDLIFRFYKQNRELYSAIHGEVLKLKK